MPRVTCRCGEKLNVPQESPEYMICTQCGARIRLRRPKPEGNDATGDGFIRFLCPCGRRLKVPTESRPRAGKCPDCGRIVPVPTTPFGTLKSPVGRNGADARTEDLDNEDLAELEKWSAQHLASFDQAEGDPARNVSGRSLLVATDDERLGLPPSAISQASVVKFETGLRVCPRCKKPLHLSADNCRECGMPVPRQ
jgi:ribosomal protein L40E